MGAILNTIPLAMSTALATDNLDFLKKKNKEVNDFVGQATKNIVGVNLIGETVDLL